MVVTVSINDQYARETKSQLFLHILWCTYDGSKLFLIRYKLEQLSATLHFSSNTSAAKHISADTYSHCMKFIVPEQQLCGNSSTHQNLFILLEWATKQAEATHSHTTQHRYAFRGITARATFYHAHTATQRHNNFQPEMSEWDDSVATYV